MNTAGICCLNYYNENDPKAAAWLRALMDAGLITEGVVDERSIKGVQPGDLEGFAQVHLFSGVAGWCLALELAGWPKDRQVWTGSAPCQPFSQAGKRKGTKDGRHLWPEMLRLITECRPPTIFGEQVASPAGRQWLAGIRADLESLGYAVGAADLCSPSVGEEAEGWIVRGDSGDWERIVVGAPHIRQRLYWVADSEIPRQRTSRSQAEQDGRESRRTGVDVARGLGDAPVPRLEGAAGPVLQGGVTRPPRAGAWSNFEIVHCRDGKARRFEPGSFPLANGLPGRVAQLRGLGNAIVPPLAAEFVKAYLDTKNPRAACLQT